jgi:hypothetical protein
MKLQHATDQQAPFESLAHASEWGLNETAISLMGMKFRRSWRTRPDCRRRRP